MNVRSSSTAKLLSQGLQSSATTPKPRLNIKDDYVKVSPPPQGKTGGEGTLGMESGKESMVVSKVRSGLAKLASNSASSDDAGKSSDEKGGASKTPGDPSVFADQAAIAIRDQLLNTRFHQMDKSSNTLKHYYYYQAQSATSTETTQVVNNIVQDTSGGLVNNEREGTRIKLKRLKIRSVFSQTASAAISITNIKQLCYRIIIWREFVPLTPGTPPTCFQTDANPPASATAVFTRLGTPATSGEINMLAVRNPVTDRLYHIYHDEVRTLRSIAANNAGANSYVSTPYEEHQNFDIDLHNITMDYSSTTANSYLTNAIYITCITEDLSTSGQACLWQYISEIVFDDGSAVN